MAKCAQCGNSFSNWYGDVQALCANCRARNAAVRQSPAPDGEVLAQEDAHLPAQVAAGETHLSCTVVLIALNVLVFIAVVLTGGSVLNPSVEKLLRWGANYGPYTLEGQWWRLLTSTFLHGGLLHLAFNMWAFLNLGLLAEVLFGRRNFVAMYLLCGLGGSVASLWWHPTVVGVGASGAIFGIAGALLPAIFFHKNENLRRVLRGNLSSITLFVIYNIAFGAASAKIDNAAHLGGLVTGLVLGRLLPTTGHVRDDRADVRSYAALAAVAALIAGGTVYASHANAGVVAFSQAQQALRANDKDTALLQAKRAAEASPKMVAAHYLAGTLYLDRKQLDDAATELHKTVELDPKFADGHSQLCVALLRKGDLDGALGHCKLATELDPKDSDKSFNLGLVYRTKHQRAEAISAFKRAAELRPDSAEENYFYAVALLEDKRYADAVRQLEKVVQIDPDYNGAAELLRQAKEEARQP
ncbi:MAG TPA: rhomboid family intramembrane serine protease [Clostridia bacterium]|nr:rhomboid family intramembrane serine protease [Clostridia bacterium]